MTVNEVYVLMLDICSKNLQQGYLSPADFNTYINQGQRSYSDYMRGEYQRYQIQRPIAVVEFGQNQMVRQTLAPLIYGVVLNPNLTTGVAAFPSDYDYADAMWDTYGLYNIRFIQQDRQDSYIHSSIDPVVSNPVYLINHEGFKFFPADIDHATLSYVRTPPPITWGYDEDANGIPVYNPATSQDPVWSDTDILQIVVRALSLAGVQMQFGVVLQYANDIKNGGQ
jgi:hypothetical protein